jgi:DHA1 family bicyclomycin/chloramphenicol resistance-like MFS transporter
MDRSQRKTKDEKKQGVFLPILLFVMSAFPPLSTDMYLPALPDICRIFKASESTANLTLILFFVFFALSTLVWGPLSDRFGRRPALIAGLLLYSSAGAGCAMAQSVDQLVAFRILQALGTGAPVTISIAIVQDVYSGESKRRILSVLSALMMIAPAAAPVFGAAVLAFSDWRSIFISLSAVGVLCVAGTLSIRESAPEGRRSGAEGFAVRLYRVMRRPFFRRSVVIFSLPSMFILGFVGASPFIFMSHFGISSAMFSFYFALNALFSIAGSMLFVPLIRKLSAGAIIQGIFLVLILTGLLLLLWGNGGPAQFLLCVIPGTVVSAVMRPLSMDILMDRAGPDAGAASSMINFMFTILGTAGMQVLALEWNNRIAVYGIMTIMVGALSLMSWIIISRNSETGLAEEASEI